MGESQPVRFVAGGVTNRAALWALWTIAPVRRTRVFAADSTRRGQVEFWRVRVWHVCRGLEARVYRGVRHIRGDNSTREGYDSQAGHEGGE